MYVYTKTLTAEKKLLLHLVNNFENKFFVSHDFCHCERTMEDCQST